MLYIWTNASILSYVKMLSYAKDLIPDICGQHLNNSQILNQYGYKFVEQMLTFYDNIIFTQRQCIKIGRNIRSVTFMETWKNCNDREKTLNTLIHHSLYDDENLNLSSKLNT